MMYRVVFIAFLSGCGTSMMLGDDAPPPDLSGVRDLSAGVPPDLAPGGMPDAALVAARPYAVHVPTGYDAGRPTPLVVLLHGYSWSGAFQDGYFKLSDEADAKGFLLALPDGTVDGTGKRFWNADDACCDFLATGVDDVAYLSAILDDMEARYNVDRKRVFLVGHSNGAFMAHRAACDLAPRIAAIAALAGVVWKDPSKCNPSEPVAILHVHGDLDSTVLYAGGSFFQGTPAYPGAVATTQTWATKNGCATPSVPSQQGYDLDSLLAGNETRVDVYPGCKGGAVELWTIQGGIHVPNLRTPAWGDALWGFLSAHPKP
jgi:polyhydroxybutyrate depolymerase